MTCETCGEKPKKCGNCNKDFPRAVIEINNPESLVLLRKVVIPTSMGDEEQVPPAIGKYHNVILYYEANKHTYLYSSDGIPTLLETEIPQEIIDRIDTLEDDVDDLNDTIDDMEQEIEKARNTWIGNETTSSETGTTAEITTTTGDFTWAEGKTIIVNFKYKAHRTDLKIDSEYAYSIDNVRSLSGGIDSGVAIQYVCVVVGGQRSYRAVGRLRASSDVAGPVYIANNLTTGNVQLTALSAYQGKVLKDMIENLPSAPTVVQTLGTSTTDVMSQNATTKMIYPSLDNSAFSIYMNKNASDPGTALHRHIAIFPLLGATMHDEGSIAIGGDTNKHNGTDEGSKFSTAIGFGSITNENGVAVGYEAVGRGILGKSVVIGASSGPSAINPAIIEGYVALGYGAGKRNESGTTISELGWVAIGTYAPAGATGQVNISVLGSNDTTERRRFGYNNSDYRLLSGLYDPQTAHDAATKGYCDAHIINGGTTAPTTSTVGTVGTLCSTVESGTGHLYICTSDTGGTYTWQALI